MDKKMGIDHAEINCDFRIVLYQPEIPGNTGNIGRLCVGTNSELHIIKPMRFLLTDKYLKRAGLDYWSKLKLHIHENLDDFLAIYGKNNIYWCTTKTKRIYSEIEYKKSDIFIFGPESRGIPEDILHQNWSNTITIPMTEKIRSLNLSNSVSIILYEAKRQIGFAKV
jgi:tRNA (cytidine/uridine-2'-O-)-methyltransferase